MFAREHQVLHTGIFGDLYPFVRIELDRVELLVEIVINLYWD
ncbi:hypothetical protein ES703_51629 [subsurface metagenome]